LKNLPLKNYCNNKNRSIRFDTGYGKNTKNEAFLSTLSRRLQMFLQTPSLRLALIGRFKVAIRYSKVTTKI
jgi:hypothetical protein